jgi:hypothetical protein
LKGFWRILKANINIAAGMRILGKAIFHQHGDRQQQKMNSFQ